MTPRERALRTRIRRLASGMEPRLRARLFAAWDLVRALFSEAELAEAIRRGHIDRLLHDLLTDDSLDPALGSLRRLVRTQTDHAGDGWTRLIPTPLRPPLFDTLDPAVIDAVRRLDTRVFDGIKNGVRDTVRGALEDGLREGHHPRSIARRIRGAVGLGPSQEQQVLNFRRALEEGRVSDAYRYTLRDRRFRISDSMTQADIDRQVEAYRRRRIAQNAETHARTIALDSQRLAQRASWESAIRQGTVNRNDLVRKWITVGDDRVRPEHQELHGAEVGFDERYPNGELLPGESTYNCRCIERIIVKSPGMALAA